MSNTWQIHDAELVLPTSTIPAGGLQVRQGRITAIGTRAQLPPWSASDGPTYSAEGDWLVPGFVDLHVHGGDGADFMDGEASAFAAAVAAHHRHGVTSVVATSTVGTHEQVMAFLELARAFRDRGLIPGAHLYGPFFAPEKVGCHPAEPARPPTAREVHQILRFADVLLTATCAPELPGAQDFYARAAAAGVRLNAGHSNATWEEMAAAFAAGVRHVDHFYCAMSSVPGLRPRCGFPMRASMTEFVLATPEMTTEVIADGQHLSEQLIRFVVQMKGADRVAAVSDANRAVDCPPGEYIFGPRQGGTRFRSDGTVGRTLDGAGLASGVRPLDFQLRHLVHAVGLDVTTAVRLVATTPAEIAGLSHRCGRLAVGLRADLVRLSRDWTVRQVWLAGEPISLMRGIGVAEAGK